MSRLLLSSELLAPRGRLIDACSVCNRTHLESSNGRSINQLEWRRRRHILELTSLERAPDWIAIMFEWCGWFIAWTRPRRLKASEIATRLHRSIKCGLCDLIRARIVPQPPPNWPNPVPSLTLKSG